MAFWGKKDENDDKKPEKAVEAVENKTAPSQSSSISVKEAVDSHKVDARGEPYGKVRSALGPGTIIQGKLSFDTVVSIDGKLGGEIFSSKALLVGKSGVVDATIDAQVLIVKGVVRGTIRASERIELREGGQIIGDIHTPIFVMDDGCVFNGSCSMPPATLGKDKGIELKKDAKDSGVVSPSPKSSGDVEQISVV